MVLYKRIFRELQGNFVRYLALFVLIALGAFYVVSLIASSEAVESTVAENAVHANPADGEFRVFAPLLEEDIAAISNAGVTIEENFYLNFGLGGSTIRIFENRNTMNIMQIGEGKKAETHNEICIEKHYAESNLISVSDAITIAGVDFVVSGICTAIDYETVLENHSDPSANSKNFGIAFVTKEGYSALKNTKLILEAETLSYAYLLNDAMQASELKDIMNGLDFDISKVDDAYFVKKVVGEEVWEKIEAFGGWEKFRASDAILDLERKGQKNLIAFTENASNPRMGNSVDDVSVNKICGIIGGIIAFILISFIMSVFAIHSVEEESAVIGTLYAMGISKKAMMFQYVVLPVMITLFASVVGTVLGFSSFGLEMQLDPITNYYSMPDVAIVYPVYLAAYGLFVPVIVSVIVNVVVIYGKLSLKPLELLRGQRKGQKISRFKLSKLSFSASFFIRRMIRERVSNAAVFVGIFLATLLLMISMNIYVSIQNMIDSSAVDCKFEYMYSLKYQPAQIPPDAHAGYAKQYDGKAPDGSTVSITILGIEKDNPFFDVSLQEDEQKITASSSVALKFKIKAGDTLELTDHINRDTRLFSVGSIGQYAVGSYVFMDLNTMRELFGVSDAYYNVLFSSKALDINTEDIYSVLSNSDIQDFGIVFRNNLNGLMIVVAILSILIFVAVMYLMMKVMVDRSAFSISLMKIFGYNGGEIKKLYLNANFIVVAVSTAVSIYFGKRFTDSLWPMFVAHVSTGIDVSYKMQQYLLIAALILAAYFVVNFFLTFHLRKVEKNAVSILKERE